MGIRKGPSVGKIIMSSEGEERRKHPRSTRGFVRVEDRSDRGLINRIENISCSGVLCHTKRPVSEMTKMSIVLDLPEPANRQIEAEGIVVRCVVEDSRGESFRVAIVYTKVSEDAEQAIREYVEHDLAQNDQE